ncbi:MAG: hypothetical protein RJQ10_16995 [Haliea sp.]|uniref:hypothetical protein n=1 Tax=Haliea sp. TaxID=1932666 RepID=UPI0032EBF17A
MTSAANAIVAILLPWLFGSVVARSLSGPGRSVWLYLGQGYILGILAVVWLTKAWDASGWTLNLRTMAGTLILLTALTSLGILHRKISVRATVPRPADLPHSPTASWQRAILALLCLGMGTHLYAVAQELFLRPTFPWDAWRGWEPKVIQFFANRSLEAPMGTIGNYGEISTIALLWMMLASDTTHQPFLHLPWLLAYLALAATVYGHLREQSSSITSAVGAYLVLSMPYLNIHVTLAGYADIWLALAFTVGVLALADFRRNPRHLTLIVAVLMTAACFQAKRAGAGFAVVLSALLVIETSLRAPRPVRIVMAVALAIAIGVLGYTILGHPGLQLPLPGNHRLIVTSEEFRITGLMRFTFGPAWHPTPFSEAVLQFGNWHLATFLWAFAIGVTIFYREWQLLWSTKILGVLCGAGVIAGYFIIVSPEAAVDHTGLARSLTYIMPLAITSLLTIALKLGERSSEAKDPPQIPSGY